MQIQVVNYLKTHHPIITKINYFSDGCAAQYKIHNTFINLRYHKIDFNIDAERTFFATNHRKSVCDSIGGFVKRVAVNASL